MSKSWSVFWLLKHEIQNETLVIYETQGIKIITETIIEEAEKGG